MSSTTSVFLCLRARLFAERDPVDRQLAEIARQGSSMARLAIPVP